jgi:predicted nucleotidyltransferase
MAAQLKRVVEVLNGANVKFIVIGGWAAALHGSPRLTVDVDVVYARDRSNIENLTKSLQPFSPYLRGAPPGLPFKFDFATVRNGLNFTLKLSELGDVDFLGEVAGGGTYEALLPFSEEMLVFGLKFRCVGLERLIQLKRAAGRPKDLEAIAELQELLKKGKRPEN